VKSPLPGFSKQSTKGGSAQNFKLQYDRVKMTFTKRHSNLRSKATRRMLHMLILQTSLVIGN
jgi:hypothetical protein